MSMKNEIRAASVKAAGGATLTLHARETALNAFVEVMTSGLNIQLKSFSNLKTSQIQAYVVHLKAQGLSQRTVQNNLAHIRFALKSVGRAKFANDPKNSNKALGADKASRDGTHRALGAEKYAQAVEAMAKIDPGAAICLRLQRELGLRAREAVQSVQSLRHWEKCLQNGQKVSVLHGTKGGRARETSPVDRERALKAVKDAIAQTKGVGAQLIKSASLQGAMRSYGRSCKAVGLEGENASHSLRCAYAQEKFSQHLENLGDRREALAATSLDLGHGDGRGTYVAQVYLKNA